MNTRRKMFSGIVLAVAALLALSGCKKDEGEKVVLSAEFEQPAGGQKTYINDHSVCWTSGDAVRINNAEEAVAVSDGAVEVTANDNGYAVAYPFEGSTLSGSGSACNGGSVEIPDVQTYTLTSGGQQKMSSPMAARLDAANGRLYFKNLHSLIRVDVTTVGEAFALESITITSATANLAGKLGFTFTGGTTADAASAPTLIKDNLDKNNVTLKFDEPVTLAANTVDKAFYLCVAPFTNTNLEIKVTGTPQGGTYAGKKGSYVFSKENKHLDRSIMAEVKANFGDAAFVPDCRFSVGAGTTVEFSPGNLQWSAINGGTWRFAEHQWDYVGDAAGNTTIDNQKEGDVVDLFGWSTSATNYGISTSTDNANYSGDFVDWGKNIVDGSNWRTLTNAEWSYLLGISGSTRGGEHSKWWIYNMVKITDVGSAGVTGLIIYPDGVTEDVTGKLSSKSSTNVTEIFKADFEKLEALGCVFLPAAGCRDGTSVYSAGSSGYYWSSTYLNSSVAYSLYFYSGYVNPSDYVWYRYDGLSVRLVKNVK